MSKFEFLLVHSFINKINIHWRIMFFYLQNFKKNFNN